MKVVLTETYNGNAIVIKKGKPQLNDESRYYTLYGVYANDILAGKIASTCDKYGFGANDEISIEALLKFIKKKIDGGGKY